METLALPVKGIKLAVCQALMPIKHCMMNLEQEMDDILSNLIPCTFERKRILRAHC